MLDSLLHNIKSARGCAGWVQNPKRKKNRASVASKFQHSRLIKSWFFCLGLIQDSEAGKWYFFDWAVYSGTLTPSLVSPSHLRDFKRRTLNSEVDPPLTDTAPDKQPARFECEPYSVGSCETDAGCTAHRQSGVRWDKHSLMSRACQGLSHD